MIPGLLFLGLLGNVSWRSGAKVYIKVLILYKQNVTSCVFSVTDSPESQIHRRVETVSVIQFVFEQCLSSLTGFSILKRCHNM